GSGEVFPRLLLRLLKGQRSCGGLIVDVVGGADLRLLVVGPIVAIAPAHEPHTAPLSLSIAKVRLGIEAAPMLAKVQLGARLRCRNLSLCECLRHGLRPQTVEYPSNIHRRTTVNNDE